MTAEESRREAARLKAEQLGRMAAKERVAHEKWQAQRRARRNAVRVKRRQQRKERVP